MSEKDENKAVSSLDKKLEKETAANKKVNEIYAMDPELHGKSRFQARAQEIGLALLAVVIGSLGTVGIMLPNGLTFGGITGIARIIQKLTGINYSLIYYILAAIVLVIVWVFLGFREVRKIALMSVSYPTVMMVLELKKVVLIPLAATYGYKRYYFRHKRSDRACECIRIRSSDSSVCCNNNIRIHESWRSCHVRFQR